jgi:hypothetical protein
MSPLKFNVVVAPGCPAGLIEELLDADILPSKGELNIFLPLENPYHCDHLTDRNNLSGRVRLRSSPAQSFFSRGHLKWLQSNLRSCDSNNLLIYNSPYQDPKTALTAMLMLFLSGRRSITLLFATPGAIIKTNGQGFSDKWISQELNLKIMAREFNKILFFLLPMFIFYLFLFWGLIARDRLAKFVSSLSQAS